MLLLSGNDSTYIVICYESSYYPDNKTIVSREFAL